VRYQPYHTLHATPNVIVDGSPTDGTALTITHWPGYPPPEPIADDLSAQMAFRLLEHPDLLPAGVDAVSNNHFDQDGLVSIYALVAPEDAQARRQLLEDVAAAGDFATFQTRDAARLSMVLAACARGDDDLVAGLPADYAERTATLYGELLGRLPELCTHIDRYRRWWGEEDATLGASIDAIERGVVGIEEAPDIDLAIVMVGAGAPTGGGHRFGHDWVDGLHPMAVCGATQRLVVATIRDGSYQVELRYESWVQLRSRPTRLRQDLVPLAARLQDDERGDVIWHADRVGSLTPRLTASGATSIPPAMFLATLTDHLRTAPAAWDPFDVRSG